jgi:hypothetical protein
VHFEEADQPSTAAISHAPPGVGRTPLLSARQAHILHLASLVSSDQSRVEPWSKVPNQPKICGIHGCKKKYFVRRMDDATSTTPPMTSIM